MEGDGITVDYKKVKCTSQNENKSLLIETKEGETITFPESYQYCVVKQEPTEADDLKHGASDNKILLWENKYGGPSDEPLDFTIDRVEFINPKQGDGFCRKNTEIADTSEALDSVSDSTGSITMATGSSLEAAEAEMEGSDSESVSLSGSPDQLASNRKPIDEDKSLGYSSGGSGPKSGSRTYSLDFSPEELAEANRFVEAAIIVPYGEHFPGNEGRKTKLAFCTLCQKTFCSRKSLRRHVRSHTGEKPLRCEVCDRRFGDKGNLKRHMLTHTGEKDFECPLCRKRFGAKATVQRHMLTHTGERPYACHLCEKRFTEKSTLRRHLICHSNEKYSCEICNKKLSKATKTALQTHMMTHTGEKPHTCKVCGKGFCMKTSLNRHLLSHKDDKSVSSGNSSC